MPSVFQIILDCELLDCQGMDLEPISIGGNNPPITCTLFCATIAYLTEMFGDPPCKPAIVVKG